ncbi:MAG: AraC family transcriptional regulator [Eubacterium sp.]|nr:AraC family transcriptional regulator [Eubacterium sp.]
MSNVTFENYSPAQKSLAVQIDSFLRSHLEEKVTIAMLADQFECSPTTIKTAFRSYYDRSVYSSFKSMKMRAAAEDLAVTDCSIMAIAAKYGYVNCSKFSDAFRKVMGSLPGKYRRAARKK